MGEAGAVGRVQYTLTQQEIAILQWLSYGKTNRDIACIMRVSVSVVEQKVFKLKNKIAANTQAGAVGIALRNGIIK